MATERVTEDITLKEMSCSIGVNPFGMVYEQGDVEDNAKISAALKKCGGKPIFCPLDDYETRGTSKAKPEFIISFTEDSSTIICVECKKSVKKHESGDNSHPKDYAVDGVLYYSKYLKEEFNVIAVAVSGIKKTQLKVSTFYWARNNDDYNELTKARCILEPLNYIKLIKGKKLEKNTL